MCEGIRVKITKNVRERDEDGWEEEGREERSGRIGSKTPTTEIELETGGDHVYL